MLFAALPYEVLDGKMLWKYHKAVGKASPLKLFRNPIVAPIAIPSKSEGHKIRLSMFWEPSLIWSY